MQAVAVANTGLVDGVGCRAVWSFANGYVAPTGIRSVVDRVHAAAGSEHEVVGITEAGRVHLHGTAGDETRLVKSVVASERIVGVGRASPRFVVERRNIVSGVANGIQIDLQNGGRQGKLRQEGEPIGGCPHVRVAALSDVERIRGRVQLKAIR